MNRVPAANTKSAPKTEVMAAGKPKAQYGAFGSMSAKRSAATDVMSVPSAGRGSATVHRKGESATGGAMPRRIKPSIDVMLKKLRTHQPNQTNVRNESSDEDIAKDSRDEHRDEANRGKHRAVALVLLVEELRGNV